MEPKSIDGIFKTPKDERLTELIEKTKEIIKKGNINEAEKFIAENGRDYDARIEKLNGNDYLYYKCGSIRVYKQL